MAEFFTGCTHFGHQGIIRLAGRPFESVHEMDSTLTDNWNKVVKPQDTVYHLGDFTYKGKRAWEYERHLNGTLVRVQGNHDKKDWGQDYLTIDRRNTKIVMFHYSIEEWDQWFRGSIHLHCHTHKKEFRSGERRYNVGVDATGFTPVSLEEIFDTYFDKEKR